MDAVLEYILLDARGLLWLRSFVPSSYGLRVGSPRVCSTRDTGSCPGSMREVGQVARW
jgi:hypothetical protein